MNYQRTIDYLFTRLPMFSRIGASAIRKDLTNTYALCKVLGDPHTHFKSIHVAGTNGKGSCSHMLASILQTAGYKTGLYTSPHLHDFRERIRINGVMIPEDSVIEFTNRIRPAIDTIDPSFFEMTVAMAFDFFSREKVDIAIVEVGLGGRLDSTNVIVPELSVITNIGYDHMNLLGNSLEAIAVEKAGIIKNNIPVIIGEHLPETKQVFERIANEKSAPIYFASETRYVSDWQYEKYHTRVCVSNLHNDDREWYLLDLPGYYQNKNLLTVLETIQNLQEKGWQINKQHILDGLAKTKKLTGLRGRWELVHTHPDIILDVAHNEDGMKQVVAQLELTNYDQLHIIIGMVKDKEVIQVLSLLPKEASYYFTKANIPRAMPEEKLFALGQSAGLQGKPYPDVTSSLIAAKSKARRNDLILVCGSVFVVGEVIT